MKHPKGVWVRWFGPRRGLVSDDRAGTWLDELQRCGLPGSDNVAAGFNQALDAWSTYGDLQRLGARLPRNALYTVWVFGC